MGVSVSRPPSEARALADEAYALVQVDPRRARTLAARALASAQGDAGALVAAHLALAWAQHELGDESAVATAKAGIRIGVRAGDVRGVALLRRRLAYAYALAGKPRAARREIDAAVSSLSGSDRARSEVFRLLVHNRAPADAESEPRMLADAAAALAVLRRSGDAIWEARLLYNRGM